MGTAWKVTLTGSRNSGTTTTSTAPLLDSFAVSDVGLLALMTEAEAERMPLDEAEQILLGAPGYPWLFISVPF